MNADELRKLARECIQSKEKLPHKRSHYEDVIWYKWTDAASPAAVLALLDRIAELEEHSDIQHRDCIAFRDERDEARAAVKRLAGALDDVSKWVGGMCSCRADDEYHDGLTAVLQDPVVQRIVEGDRWPHSTPHKH